MDRDNLPMTCSISSLLVALHFLYWPTPTRGIFNLSAKFFLHIRKKQIGKYVQRSIEHALPSMDGGLHESCATHGYGLLEQQNRLSKS